MNQNHDVAPGPLTPDEVLAKMHAHYEQRREGWYFHQLGAWLVHFGELQVELAEAIVAQSRR